jgi:hypothetical protein
VKVCEESTICEQSIGHPPRGEAHTTEAHGQAAHERLRTWLHSYCRQHVCLGFGHSNTRASPTGPVQVSLTFDPTADAGALPAASLRMHAVGAR